MAVLTDTPVRSGPEPVDLRAKHAIAFWIAIMTFVDIGLVMLAVASCDLIL